jgi:hypothetical protein
MICYLKYPRLSRNNIVGDLASSRTHFSETHVAFLFTSLVLKGTSGTHPNSPTGSLGVVINHQCVVCPRTDLSLGAMTRMMEPTFCLWKLIQTQYSSSCRHVHNLQAKRFDEMTIMAINDSPKQ